MRIKICLSNQAPPNPATTCLVRLLVPNLCSYKRLANGAVKIISAFSMSAKSSSTWILARSPVNCN